MWWTLLEAQMVPTGELLLEVNSNMGNVDLQILI
jgi:hypothetical protein